MNRVRRRIYGLETEYGITCTLKGQRRLTPDEVARYLFRSVVSWGRSSNVFMENGGRLYLDVGSHPEFATPECDSVLDVVCYERAGDEIMHDLVGKAESRLRDEGIRGTVHLFKNNTDSAGNSYGCHENYLLGREGDDALLESVFIPFLVSRQIVCGAGRILSTSRGPVFSISQRAEHIWESMSSATTRSRPIINTRDEPHADAESYRRLHVIVGDSNMSEHSTYVKISSAACVLRLMEQSPGSLRDLSLENPIRAIRDISSDESCRRTVRTTGGRALSALDIQRELLDKAIEFDSKGGYDDRESAGLVAWRRVVEGLEAGGKGLETSVDWIIKRRLLDRYCERHGVGLDSPEAHLIDLQYHDVNPARGLFHRLAARGLADTIVSEDEVRNATTQPPATTRARLRGEFLKRARERQRDVTVDWVHLKVNDQAQRTVVCKDPFKSRDERVDKLMASL
jgi:proteasome accessory factor A